MKTVCQNNLFIPNFKKTKTRITAIENVSSHHCSPYTMLMPSYHLLLHYGLSKVEVIHHFENFTVATMQVDHYGISVSQMTTSATSGAGTSYPSGAPEFTPVFSGVRVTRSLVLCVCFVDRCLSFCTFSFGHCVVCSSSIYGF